MAARPRRRHPPEARLGRAALGRLVGCNQRHTDTIFCAARRAFAPNQGPRARV